MLLLGQAHAETRTFDIRDFDEVSVGYGMRVSISQGGAYRIEATGEERDLNRLEVRQNGRRLEFSMDSSWMRWSRLGRINLDITLPMLRKLGLSGGSQATLDMRIGSESFSADLSGGSSLNGQMSCGDLNLSASGGSRVGLSGSGTRLRLSGSGGSRFEMRNFAATDVRASLSGGSGAIVNVNGGLSAGLTGGSDVTYYGNARLGSIGASGGSRVRHGS